MRRLLVDQARRRRRRAAKREERTLDGAIAAASGIDVDLIDLDEALRELAGLDEREARVVELRYFGGLKNPEVARVLDVSVQTIERDWRSTKAWLADRLGGAEERPEM